MGQEGNFESHLGMTRLDPQLIFSTLFIKGSSRAASDYLSTLETCYYYNYHYIHYFLVDVL